MSFNPGGGGGISNASDVVLSNPTTNEALSYDGATQKWKNAPVTKSQVGLANVDNTSDANKPISSATQTALNAKVDTAQLGVANGVATLGSDGKLPSPQAPAIDASLVATGTLNAARIPGHASYYDVVYDVATGSWPIPPSSPAPPDGHRWWRLISRHAPGAVPPQTQSTPGKDWSFLTTVNSWVWEPAPGVDPT